MLNTLWELTGGLPQGCRILCAVSGGADSVCLLHRLWALQPQGGFTVVAAHYNHRLRGAESDRDEAFVRDLVSRRCGEIGSPAADPPVPAVRLVVGSGDVASEARRRGLGVEEMAREMRYAFLQETAEQTGCAFIATAHNADDNAETLLLHLLRGTGLRGLGGIPPRRGNIIRPLLRTTRAQIETYLNEQDLSYVTDSTNLELQYLRNRVRRQVIPLLEDLAPGFTLRSRDIIASLRADEDILTGQAAAVAALAQMGPESLSIPAAAVSELPDPVAVRVIRLLIGRLNGGDQDCAAVHLQSVLQLCRSADPSAQVNLPWQLTARRVYDRLVLSRGELPAACPDREVPLPGIIQTGFYEIRTEHEVYAGQRHSQWEFWLSDTLSALRIRPRRTGDDLQLPGRHTRTLKKLLIDARIPKGVRDTLPVFCTPEGTLAAAAAFGPDASCVPVPGTGAWHVTISPQQIPPI